MTIPTHFYDNGVNLKELGVTDRAGIEAWYERVLAKLARTGKQPHPSASELLKIAYQKLRIEVLSG